jgi:hypothetical protein
VVEIVGVMLADSVSVKRVIARWNPLLDIRGSDDGRNIPFPMEMLSSKK